MSLLLTTLMGNPRISITDQLVQDIKTSPADATATYTVDNDGKIRSHTGSVIETWLNKPSLASLYEVFVSVTSGALTSGTTGAWLNCGTDRSWSLTRDPNGTSTTVIAVQIRRAATGLVKDTANITLQAIVEAP